MYSAIVQWVRLVKLAEKPGDMWDDGCNTGTYQFMRFRKQPSQTAEGAIELVQAVLRHKWCHADTDGVLAEIDTEVVLEKSGGIQSEKAVLHANTDQPRLVRERLLVSSHH